MGDVLDAESSRVKGGVELVVGAVKFQLHQEPDLAVLQQSNTDLHPKRDDSLGGINEEEGDVLPEDALEAGSLDHVIDDAGHSGLELVGEEGDKVLLEELASVDLEEL